MFRQQLKKKGQKISIFGDFTFVSNTPSQLPLAGDFLKEGKKLFFVDTSLFSVFQAFWMLCELSGGGSSPLRSQLLHAAPALIQPYM
jgi:hypothetical protein